MQTPRDTDAAPASELGALIAATEGLQPMRRICHAAWGIVLAIAPMALGLPRTPTVAILAAVLVLQLALDAVRFRVEAVQKLFFRLARTLASPREAEGLASSTWYTLGALVAYAVFPMGIASPAILVLALADPAAGTVGRLFGRRRFGTGSVEGSAVFFVTATVILLVAVDWPAALIAAAAATLVEVVPGIGDDNLVIPLVTGGVLWLVLSGPI